MILLVSLACEKHGEWRYRLAVLYHPVTSSNLIQSYTHCWLSWLTHLTSWQDDPSSCTVAAPQTVLVFVGGSLQSIIWCSSLWIFTFRSGVGCGVLPQLPCMNPMVAYYTITVLLHLHPEVGNKSTLQILASDSLLSRFFQLKIFGPSNWNFDRSARPPRTQYCFFAGVTCNQRIFVHL